MADDSETTPGKSPDSATTNASERNLLGQETSPYLLQHRDNPVHWYPWGEAALAAARSRQKPILLSIGYSACHWCHVMAHESFEDPATAALMNEHFINIKVDREERPDLDKIYQLAHQVLTQNGGGWPLTMFLDPDTHLPFFGGTYFPKTPSYQLPGFADLLLRIDEVFQTKRDELTTQGNKVNDLLLALGGVASGEGESAEHPDYAQLADTARDALAEQYDDAAGGFGAAPKFPNTPVLTFLLERWAIGDKTDRQAFDMAITSLTRMARGGIYDHLGGGFCRYATDRQWMIPHFEKMLYDNGALLSLFTQALRIGPDALFEDAIIDTVGWLQREMRHPDGAFYAALDADSEGEEGKYYVWQRNQIKRLLTGDEYLLIETLYGLDKPANFESRWNLHRRDSWRSVVERIMLESDDPRAVWQSARAKLLAERATRVAPGVDDKVLAGWNGLAIDGLATAGLYLDRPDWVTLAQNARDFVRERMFVDGRLYATWKNDTPAHPAYLDDYAFCLQGLMSLLQAQWRESDVTFAKALADTVLASFAGEHGGFYFTADDHERLIHRPMPTMDEATAAGNAVLGCALYDLGHLLADTRYIDAAQATLNWAQRFVAHYPAGHCAMLSLAARFSERQQQVILRGPIDADWLAACRKGYTPWRRTYVIPYDDVRTLPGYLPRIVSSDVRNQSTAYVCSGMQCSLPIQTIEELQAALGS